MTVAFSTPAKTTQLPGNEKLFGRKGVPLCGGGARCAAFESERKDRTTLILKESPSKVKERYAPNLKKCT
eukprot:m.110256 g.110256  ORF g.110256 m.110256 type:complete len:70 (-) comp14031_c0_seq4:217-426(-)